MTVSLANSYFFAHISSPEPIYLCLSYILGSACSMLYFWLIQVWSLLPV